MENRDLIILTILTLLVGAGLWWQENNWSAETGSVSVRTDKIEYSKTDALKVAIENNLGEKVCFSSCYPFYWERKEDNWNLYSYSECQKSDVSKICVDAHQAKFFQIDLSLLEAGIHRLIIPLCLNCKNNDAFREDGKVYSNEFLVK